MESNNENNNNSDQTKSLAMEHLPEQVVSEVFQYLDTNDLNQMALASHDWKSMTENDTLRRHINCIEVDGKNIEAHHNVTRGIKYCDKLVLKKCTISSKKFGRILKEIGGKLKSIQLIDSYFTDNHHDRIFKYIAEYCPMIESIEITSTNPEKFVIFKEADLEPLLECPNLHTIKIDGLEHKDFRIILKLLKKVWHFEYTSIISHPKYDSPLDPITYCPKRNAIFRQEYIPGIGWKVDQILPEPKEDPNGCEPGRINGWIEGKFYDYHLSFKMNTYEVIDINEYEKTITIIDDEGNIEEYKPSAEFFQEILDEMKENEQCFISLIHIHQKNIRAPYDEISGTIENGIMNRPPYWN